ncbi:hypothetical protein LCER1_G002835 [Lachnellula cervina]|uniref:Xylanolytic transcriptional activator regulatory domain-containing protein n=1 Tax=Lachnellula cervina TaxID=1316786 RepID=A0A7D8UQ10_9HELO|nr:hypothetical protein LCER1_G002835 [Lachnellula cervina]
MDFKSQHPANSVHASVSTPEDVSPSSQHDRGFYVSSPASQMDRSVEESERDVFSQSILNDLCNAWFERYHPWFPILHRLSVIGTIEDTVALEESPIYIVLKAIIAVTLPHWSLSNPISRETRSRISEKFRKQVILQAISDLSLPSLQAVLIVTTIDYGAGRLSEFWNLVALCKRWMGIQLGLRDLVANKFDNFNKLSTLPPRMIPVPTSLIEQEEKIRAYWMTEVLDSMSSLGAGWNLSLSLPESELWFPCNEAVWAFPEKTTSLSSFDDSEVSSAFSVYLNLVTHQLYQVHLFLQQSYDATSAVDRARWQSQCITVDEALDKWRNSNLETTYLGHDSTVVLSAVTFNAAIIALYQRLALPPKGLAEVHGPWYHAIQRCLNACDEMSTVIRAINDADLENMSPHMIFCIFVAARFYLVHAKVLSVEIPRSLDLLIYGLKTCGQRWYFARRLEQVLHTAIAEKQVPVVMSALPQQFYDLQYSSLDIDHALSIWAEDCRRPSI